MVSFRTLFKCEKCGFEKVFLMGDDLHIGDFFKICPKCKGTMKRVKILD